jgi:hypothetical protein
MQRVRATQSERPFWNFAMSQCFSDTSPEAAEVQAAIMRKKTGEERLEFAFEMCATARELCLSRLRAQHPEWNHRDFMKELLRIALLPEPMPADW